MMKKGRPQRVGDSFIDKVTKIRIERIKRGMDKPTKSISFHAITEMLPRHTNWAKIEEDLINWDVKKNRSNKS